MRLRFATSALVFLVAMTMATGAFAQGIFTLSAGSEARGRANGYAEKAGGVSLFLTTGSIAADDKGTVVINYGVPITNKVSLAVPATDAGGVNIEDTDNAISVILCGSPNGAPCGRRRCWPH